MLEIMELFKKFEENNEIEKEKIEKLMQIFIKK